MTDRELLELAAKAAGIVVNRKRQDERDAAGFPDVGLWTTTATNWNPLTDDGDALRLVIKIGINISLWGGTTYINKPGSGPVACNEVHGLDAHAATRRAIVRAAAEIGKAMP